MSGCLYVCATPIGNLKDSSDRLKETLKHVDLIAAEDTRKAKLLCEHLNIQGRFISLEKFNEDRRKSDIAKKLETGQNIALISEAGTPNISDPGAHLIRHLIEKNLPVTAIPGPSSVTTHLSIAGVLANQFHFLGFLPKKRGELEKRLSLLAQLDCPILCFVSAKQLLHSIDILASYVDITYLSLAKELTKKFETVISGSLVSVKSSLENVPIKGEWTLLMTCTPRAQDPSKQLQALHNLKLSQKQFVSISSQFLNIPRNTAYRYWTQHHD